jgi:Zn-dependent alcohol dehydrogenase
MPLQQCANSRKVWARIILLKLWEVSLPAFDFISEKNIRGCFYGSSHFHVDVPVILERIQAGRMRTDGMVSHSMPLEELETAFSRMRNGDGVRTILRF